MENIELLDKAYNTEEFLTVNMVSLDEKPAPVAEVEVEQVEEEDEDKQPLSSQVVNP